ncbi:MAG: AAA family ATPase [Lachnospiraceae bacterium]|nr:AAA family ATPase [Lachnospiraceae bacterium]
MEKLFITSLTIESVRHLKDITIPLSEEKPKHLILTGRNGSGKTSVLEALASYLNSIKELDLKKTAFEFVKRISKSVVKGYFGIENSNEINNLATNYESSKDTMIESGIAVDILFSQSLLMLIDCFKDGEFILAYYKAERSFNSQMPKHVEKIVLKDYYSMTESPRQLFVKYLLDIKMTEALARGNGHEEKANVIHRWFEKFEELLRQIFEDDSLKLVFDEDDFSFHIKEKNRELFDFNTLSSGYAAILDIVLDLIVRMEKKTNKSFVFDMQGVVLIDEIETHLHLELQKNILPMLTTIFPNIQFIVSTHSPFILNSLEDAVIYDLEKNIMVEHGLSDIPYGGVVEGYFNASELSDSLREKYERYKELVKKKELSDEDFEEIARLEMYLNEIPDYLALNITTEYQRCKMEFENREDI